MRREAGDTLLGRSVRMAESSGRPPVADCAGSRRGGPEKRADGPENPIFDCAKRPAIPAKPFFHLESSSVGPGKTASPENREPFPTNGWLDGPDGQRFSAIDQRKSESGYPFPQATSPVPRTAGPIQRSASRLPRIADRPSFTVARRRDVRTEPIPSLTRGARLHASNEVAKPSAFRCILTPL